MKSTKEIFPAQVNNDMQPEEFDLVILGGGTGSTIAAWTFAGEGKRVAVIDRKYIGGSCPNIACLPSKNIIHSAKIASYIRRSKEFGIAHDGFAVDMFGVRERKRKMVTGLNEMYLENFQLGRRYVETSDDVIKMAFKMIGNSLSSFILQKGAQSGLWTHIVTTESGSWCAPMKN
jgi:hypothetical protein